MDSVLPGFQDLIGQSYGKPICFRQAYKLKVFRGHFQTTFLWFLQYCDANFLQHQDSRHFRNVNVFKKHHFVPQLIICKMNIIPPYFPKGLVRGQFPRELSGWTNYICEAAIYYSYTNLLQLSYHPMLFIQPNEQLLS